MSSQGVGSSFYNVSQSKKSQKKNNNPISRPGQTNNNHDSDSHSISSRGHTGLGGAGLGNFNHRSGNIPPPGQITPASRRFTSQVSQRGGNTNNPASILSPGTINEMTSTMTDEQNAFCWGTNIDMEASKNKIESFLKEFKALVPEIQIGLSQAPRSHLNSQSQNQSQMDLEPHSEEEQIGTNRRRGADSRGSMIQRGNEMREEKIYMKALESMVVTQNYTLTIDADHLYQYDKVLYMQLIDYPAEMIPLFDLVLAQVFTEVSSTLMPGQSQTVEMISKNVMLGIVNLRESTRIRELDPIDINKLISIKGIVIRCSDVTPEMKSAFFRCVVCGTSEYKGVDQGRVDEPIDCLRCKAKHCFQIDHNRCVFVDKQYVKIQEKPDDIPEGETPATVTLLAYDSNVDDVRPGDKIEVIGVYRASAMRKNRGRRTLNCLFNTYIDVVSYGKLDKHRFMGATPIQDGMNSNVEDNKIMFTEEVRQKLFQIADDNNVYERLVTSLAPSIFEQEDVKQGILCQLFGGTQKDFSHSGKGRFRADINVLLIGDPSMAKSQFLQFVNKIAPRGIYTSGQGSSAVGLTAYVSKDPETKELVLESGALVLSDLGICCIDEFDKMAESTRSILHEAMEQQTISIAKAGIVAQLNARTAILAGANPVGSRYESKKSVIENINLPPSLISRFDLIYILLDKNDELTDRKLADHILKLYVTSPPQNQEVEPQVEKKKPKKSRVREMMNLDSPDAPSRDSMQIIRQKLQPKNELIDLQTLSQYITFARQEIKPKLTQDVSQLLVKGYLEMRKLGANRKTITSTPRQLESMIRISEALAKMRFAEFVTSEDVEEALRLIKVATMQAATDPTTGLIDVDLLTSGITAQSRQKIPELVSLISEYITENMDQFKNANQMMFGSLKEEINILIQNKEQKISEVQDFELVQALSILANDNQIMLLKDQNRPNIRVVGNFSSN